MSSPSSSRSKLPSTGLSSLWKKSKSTTTTADPHEIKQMLARWTEDETSKNLSVIIYHDFDAKRPKKPKDWDKEYRTLTESCGGQMTVGSILAALKPTIESTDSYMREHGTACTQFDLLNRTAEGNPTEQDRSRSVNRCVTSMTPLVSAVSLVTTVSAPTEADLEMSGALPAPGSPPLRDD